MNRIDKVFLDLKKRKKTGLITFITAGDPDLRMTKSLVLEMEKNGADIIELGVPFTDPLADGPTIQKASLRALKNNTSLKDVIGLIRDIRKDSQIPLVIMSSYNPILRYGEEKFIKDACVSGLDGAIIPDLPPEEGENLIRESESVGLNLIFLIAPTTPHKRAKLIAEKSRGFIYYISLLGITGERKGLSREIKKGISKIRNLTDKPVAVGFGISSPEQIEALSSIADGVIIGSAIVKVIEKNLKNQRLISSVGKFVNLLKKSIH
ncbi:MAG TPA: tryptophan synthase subunit alpha [Nitrospinota bacterium]|nr:tryptophan synthase subunit alpha [Nitrospinota bacterium]